MLYLKFPKKNKLWKFFYNFLSKKIKKVLFYKYLTEVLDQQKNNKNIKIFYKN